MTEKLRNSVTMSEKVGKRILWWRVLVVLRDPWPRCLSEKRMLSYCNYIFGWLNLKYSVFLTKLNANLLSTT